MDPALAALYGAIIGGAASLVGSVLAPALSAFITRRSHERTAIRDEQRREIDAFNRAAVDLVTSVNRRGWRNDETMQLSLIFSMASGRLSLLIPRSSDDVVWMIDQVGQKAAEGDRDGFIRRFDACQETLSIWYRRSGRINARREFNMRLDGPRSAIS